MQTQGEKEIMTLAKQLKHPHGILGKQVAEKMNKGNYLMNLETIEYLDLAQDDNVLEIGMGNGFFVRNILSAAKGIKYFGCDSSITMVNEAIRINDNFIRRNQARFMLAKATKLPYNNEQFEKVFTVNTIYFWEDIRIVLDEMKRVMKKHGTMIITLRPHWVMDSLPVTRYGYRTYTEEAIVDLLMANGFMVTGLTEKEDIEIKYGEQSFENAFLVVKALLR